MSVSVVKYLRDESGATFVEFTLVVVTFLTIVLGFVDFSHVFLQWNSATKAVQLGARLAAVSDPVPAGLRNVTGLSATVLPGMAMPAFSYQCVSTAADGSTGTCTGTTSLSYSAQAMRDIVFGRGRTNSSFCEVKPATDEAKRRVGMCNIFSRIDPRNVVVKYEYTGLGYAGRPGGPVPTITVSLTGLTFDYVFLGDLLGLSSFALPGFATTVTGEDLKLAGT